MTAPAFKHDENQIDPRDPHLVTYNKEKKWLITETSDLQAAGIEPKFHNDIYKYWYIWVWSEQFQLSILYKKTRDIMNGDEKVGDIFEPDFTMITSDAELKARNASRGTQLHILND